MRFLLFRQVPKDSRFRWFRLLGHEGWVDMRTGAVHGLLVLFGPGAGALRLGLRDAHGADVPLEVTPAGASGARLPENAGFFLSKPQAERQVVELRFALPDDRPLVLTGDGATLAEFRTGLAFPEHVFALVRRFPGRYAQFVETGTLFGHTALHASHWFDHVTTIELSPELHAMAVESLAYRPNILCLQGNSGVLLERVIDGLAGAPTLFFLDAHFSGDAATDWGASTFTGYPVDTARIDDPGLSESERQVPLLHELRLIAERHAGEALVLIDDWLSPGRRDAQFAGEDWSGIDPAALLAWMAAHPRTLEHYADGVQRHVWRLAAAG